MKLPEIAGLLDLELEIQGRCYPDQDYRIHWTAQFKAVEVKDGVTLRSEYGTGETPKAAVADYIKLISGKQLVFAADVPSKRHMFKLPKGVTP